MFGVARISDRKWVPVSEARDLRNSPWATPPSACGMKMLFGQDPCPSPLEASSVLGQRGPSVRAVPCVVDACSPQRWEHMGSCRQIPLVSRRRALAWGSGARKTCRTSTVFPSEASPRSWTLTFQIAVAETFTVGL